MQQQPLRMLLLVSLFWNWLQNHVQVIYIPTNFVLLISEIELRNLMFKFVRCQLYKMAEICKRIRPKLYVVHSKKNSNEKTVTLQMGAYAKIASFQLTSAHLKIYNRTSHCKNHTQIKRFIHCSTLYIVCISIKYFYK